MANNYFQFKHFTVQQDQCAMKVCTDACIFGAYIGRYIYNTQPVANNILDIGTGTGLLSLMVAQKTNGSIDGVEIDEAAFNQARRNFKKSPWNSRLNIFNADALKFNPGKKYDCIISNPPFFEGDLRSGNKKKNAAKHETGLTLAQLLLVIDQHLSPQGLFTVLLPYHRIGFFIEICNAADYFVNKQVLIQPTSKHPFFRGILILSRNKTIVGGSELVIKDESGGYTPEFIELLEDYYLPEGLRCRV